MIDFANSVLPLLFIGEMTTSIIGNPVFTIVLLLVTGALGVNMIREANENKRKMSKLGYGFYVGLGVVISYVSIIMAGAEVMCLIQEIFP